MLSGEAADYGLTANECSYWMGDERLFDAHMFAKHSFGVKYPLEISRRSGPAPRPMSHPRSKLQIMTATLTTQPHQIPAPVAASPRLAPEIYRARRLAVLALAIGLIVGTAVGLVSNGNQAGASLGDHAADDALVVTVMPGDTLWQIARSLSPNNDPRGLVHDLASIAGAGPIQPGQQLVIPRSVLD